MPIFSGVSHMQPKPVQCANCRQHTLLKSILPTYATEVEHDGRKYPIELTDFSVLRCQNDTCGTIVLDDDASERLDEALRAKAGLLTPAQIRQGREVLGLNQKDAAQYLRISVSTLCRWETGAQIQQRAMDGLLRVFFKSAEARRILGVPESRLDASVNLENLVDRLDFVPR